MENEEIEIRDHREKGWFWLDQEYLNGYAQFLSPAATLVYIGLCRHADKHQESHPSIDILSQKLNLSRPTIIRATKELETWKIIRVERSKNEQTKRQNPNIYILLNKKKWNQKPSKDIELGSTPKTPENPNEKPSKDFELGPQKREEPSKNDDQKPSKAVLLELNNTNTTKLNTLAKAKGKTPDKRNPEIQELWEYGLSQGLSNTKQNLNRFAIKRLLRQHTPEQLKKAIEFSQAIREEPYAPQVHNWLDLEDKYLKLRDFAQRHNKKINEATSRTLIL